jgi:DNA modification methylase
MIEPYYHDPLAGITIYHGRCEDVLPSLDRVDHMITDPPYSDHVHSKNRRGGSLPDATKYKACISRARELGFESLSPELMDFVGQQIARLVKRWALIFSDDELLGAWRSTIRNHKPLEVVRMGIWVKLNATPQFTGDRPAPGFECITIAHPKGKKRWNGGGKHAVWTYPIVINRGGKDPRLHTTQKPLSLMQDLVASFTDPGETILDCFGGSGTTALACKNLQRHCILIERDERYCETAALRLSQEVFALEYL